MQSFDGSGPRDVIYTFDQIDLPELVPLSQLDKREDLLNGEIDCTGVHENTPKSATCRRAYEQQYEKV